MKKIRCSRIRVSAIVKNEQRMAWDIIRPGKRRSMTERRLLSPMPEL
jgi:hypothetical protein